MLLLYLIIIKMGQTMVVNMFLAETSQATMAGFSAEYVNLGPEAAALEAGVYRPALRDHDKCIEKLLIIFCAR